MDAMSMPKRPIFEFHSDDAAGHLWLDYEHAVAKVAVEALRKVLTDDTGDLDFVQWKLSDTLAKIEESGWKP